MAQSTVFTNNKTQAVRLPKAVALPEDVKKVEVIRLGAARLITPAGAVWDSFFDGEPASEDFLKQRVQPPPQNRDMFSC